MSTTLAAGLAPLGGIEEVRIDWRWTPAWRPADMTNSGREQLRAIGFTISAGVAHQDVSGRRSPGGRG